HSLRAGQYCDRNRRRSPGPDTASRLGVRLGHLRRSDPDNRARARTCVDGIIAPVLLARGGRSRPPLPPAALHRTCCRWDAWPGGFVADRLHAPRIVAVRSCERTRLVGKRLCAPDPRACSPEARSVAALVLARARPRAPLGLVDADRGELVARLGEKLCGCGAPYCGRRACFRQPCPLATGRLAGGRGAGGSAARTHARLRRANRARAAFQPLQAA